MPIFATGPDHPNGDLATIGDEDFLLTREPPLRACHFLALALQTLIFKCEFNRLARRALRRGRLDQRLRANSCRRRSSPRVSWRSPTSDRRSGSTRSALGLTGARVPALFDAPDAADRRGRVSNSSSPWWRLPTRAAIERLSGLRAQLKWPNDLVVGANKLAGLLAEVVESSSGIGVVVGLGVNLTHEGPEGTAATSVRAETGLTLEPIALLDSSSRRSTRASIGSPAMKAVTRCALSTSARSRRSARTCGSNWSEAPYSVARVVLTTRANCSSTIDGTLEVVSAGDVVHLRAGESARS